MRIEAGHYRRTASDGTVIHIDRPLGPVLVDLLARVIREAGHTPKDVIAIELDGDGPPRIELRPTR